MQTNCKLNNAELFLKLFYIQSKEIGNKKYYEGTRTLKNGKVRFRLNVDSRKEKEDSKLNALKTKIAFVKAGPTEFYQQEYNSSQCSPYGISFR